MLPKEMYSYFFSLQNPQADTQSLRSVVTSSLQAVLHSLATLWPDPGALGPLTGLPHS